MQSNLKTIHPVSIILQKCQLLSNQSYKHNSANMPSLNLIPKLLTFTIQKANACSPWILVLLSLLRGNFSEILGNSEQKNTLQTIEQLMQLIICCCKREFFWSILFLNKSQRRGIPLETTLVNVATCLFICH